MKRIAGQEVLTCEQAGVAVTLHRPLTRSAKAEERFSKEDFIYEQEVDAYRCPAGERFSYRYTNEGAG